MAFSAAWDMGSLCFVRASTITQRGRESRNRAHRQISNVACSMPRSAPGKTRNR
jgi:hypothetical protein